MIFRAILINLAREVKGGKMEFSVSEFLGFSDEEILVELEREGVEVSAFRKPEMKREERLALPA